MPVEITKPGDPQSFPLTSPPKKPQPLPEVKLTSRILSYGDRQVWVTIPVPDTIELIAPVLNEILDVPDLSGKDAKQLYGELDAEINSHLATVPLPAGGFVWKEKYLKSGEKARFAIEYDPHQPLNKAFLSLWRKAGPDYGSWFARLEFSPARAGPEGLEQIIDGFEHAASFLSFDKFLQTAKVSRLDVAIDCVGVVPLDVIGHVPNEGKRVVYFGDNGRPESIYIREKKKHPTSPPLKKVQTYGPLRLRIYDRSARQKQLALPPLYGGAPVTRVETTIRWKTARPPFAELLAISNRLKGVRVAYAAGILGYPSEAWHDFCLKVAAQGISNTSVFPGQVGFLKLHEKFLGDLVNSSDWTQWPAGVAWTGLDKWVETACGTKIVS